MDPTPQSFTNCITYYGTSRRQPDTADTPAPPSSLIPTTDAHVESYSYDGPPAGADAGMALLSVRYYDSTGRFLSGGPADLDLPQPDFYRDAPPSPPPPTDDAP